MASLTDTHCHLNLDQFSEDLEVVLERAAINGVEQILVPGIDLDTSRRAVEIAEKFYGVFAAIGVHPNSANSWNSGTIKEIISLSRHPKVVAIGEIGLDYYRLRTAPHAQKVVFQAQLDLASQVQLPVLIHNRQATRDLWPMLKNWHERIRGHGEELAKHPGVLHAYEDSLEMAREALQCNFQFGVGGPITYPKAGARAEVIKNLMIESILIETDAPYLSPQACRGQRNEPANVKMIAEKIAEIVNLNYDEVVEITTKNANRLFRWSPFR